MDRNDILALEETLRSDYEADIEAIRRVKLLLERRRVEAFKRKAIEAIRSPSPNGSAPIVTPPPSPAHHPELPMEADGNGHDTVESKVLKVIDGFQGQFKMADLLAALLQDFPGVTINPKTVSGVLFRLKDKTIKVVKEGRGRRAAIYAKI